MKLFFVAKKLKMSNSEVIHSLAWKQFDHARLQRAKVGYFLRIQHNGRETVFPNLSLQWRVIKNAVERDLRPCMICQNADVYMGCIYCGFGYCTSCIDLKNVNPLKCTVCTASSDLSDLLTGNVSVFMNVIPRFHIEYIFSFVDAEQELGEMYLVLDHGNVHLLKGDHDQYGRSIQTLADLVLQCKHPMRSALFQRICGRYRHVSNIIQFILGMAY